jgi:hypothetical protein
MASQTYGALLKSSRRKQRCVALLFFMQSIKNLEGPEGSFKQGLLFLKESKKTPLKKSIA